MLNLLNLRKKVYNYINDDPNGDGAYSLEEMDNFIKIAVQIFFRDSKAIQFRDLVDQQTFLQGLVEIVRFEDEQENKLKKVKYAVVGERLFMKEPVKAYVIWVYGGFELTTKNINSLYNHDIQHTISLNTVAEEGILFYTLNKIFEKETNFSLSNYYLEKAKDISFRFEKNFNSNYKGASYV